MGVKKELTAAGATDVVGPSKLCVPFQFMYAMSTILSPHVDFEARGLDAAPAKSRTHHRRVVTAQGSYTALVPLALKSPHRGCKSSETSRDRDIIFITNPPLGMIVSPHLLSLCNGFGRVDSELARLASPARGYLDYIETLTAHVATLDDGEIALAFGGVPCVCAS